MAGPDPERQEEFSGGKGSARKRQKSPAVLPLTHKAVVLSKGLWLAVLQLPCHLTKALADATWPSRGCAQLQLSHPHLPSHTHFFLFRDQLVLRSTTVPGQEDTHGCFTKTQQHLRPLGKKATAKDPNATSHQGQFKTISYPTCNSDTWNPHPVLQWRGLATQTRSLLGQRISNFDP